ASERERRLSADGPRTLVRGARLPGARDVLDGPRRCVRSDRLRRRPGRGVLAATAHDLPPRARKGIGLDSRRRGAAAPAHRRERNHVARQRHHTYVDDVHALAPPSVDLQQRDVGFRRRRPPGVRVEPPGEGVAATQYLYIGSDLRTTAVLSTGNLTGAVG